MDHHESVLPIGKTSWTNRAILIFTLALTEGHCLIKIISDMVCVYCHLSWNGYLAQHGVWYNLKPPNQSHRAIKIPFSNLVLGQVPRWLQHSSTLGQVQSCFCTFSAANPWVQIIVLVVFGRRFVFVFWWFFFWLGFTVAGVWGFLVGGGRESIGGWIFFSPLGHLVSFIFLCSSSSCLNVF